MATATGRRRVRLHGHEMIFVVIALAAIWGLGALFKVPASRSWVLTAVVLVAVLLAHALLP